MAKFPTIEEFAKSVAEKALDEYVCDGKTLRQWVLMILNGEFVPVVRCKDCKYVKDMAQIGVGEYEIGCCSLREEYGIKFMVYDDAFCSYGERKETDG